MTALIVEDGTAKSDAEGFISYADATTYIAARALTSPDGAAWTAVQATGEALLRQATDFMEGYYRARWKGFKLTPTQALSWPRNAVVLEDVGYPVYEGQFAAGEYIVANNIVPVLVQRACAELALIATDGPLAPIIERPASSEKIGSLQVAYDKDAPPFSIFRNVNMMLQPYFSGRSGSISLVRT